VASHNIGLSTIYDIKKWNGQLWLFMESCECKGPIKVTYWKTLNLHNWVRYCVSELQQCVAKKNPWLCVL
jgi:hypothetical protein